MNIILHAFRRMKDIITIANQHLKLGRTDVWNLFHVFSSISADLQSLQTDIKYDIIIKPLEDYFITIW